MLPQICPRLGRLLLGCATLFAGVSLARAAVSVPHVFADHLVLQCDQPDPVWGWAAPGETVTVSFAGQTKTATADANGAWSVRLDSLPANATPGELVIRGRADQLVIKDVLVGEVWLASGQSNMGFPLFAVHNAAEVLPLAKDDDLRFYRVTTKTAAEPQTDGKGVWELSAPDTAKNFSGVAYFFARELRQTRHVPVAVLQAPWGGTSIETWISLAGLQQNPPLTKPLAQWQKALETYQKLQADPAPETAYQADLKKWQKEVQPAYDAAQKKWNADNAAGHAVGPKPQPARPEPTNPDPMGMPSPSRRPGTPTVDFNGMISPLVPYGIRGFIWYQGEANGGHGLEYRDLFPRLITDWRQHWHRDDLPFLFVQLPCNGADPTPVAQQGWPWLREAQAMALTLPHTGMAVTIDIGDPGNVHPTDKLDVGKRLARVARQQVYGENVVASGPRYADCQFPGDGSAHVRFTHTDGGLKPDSQPWCALHVVPFPTNQVIGFFLAGADQKWAPAEAHIEGDMVILTAAAVPHPVAVRYGWANSPRCNLYNGSGLPAAPFRTDDWAK